MSPESSEGRIGFLLTLACLVALAFSFAAMALKGSSDLLLSIMGAAMILAFTGHFVLGGGDFRRQMLEEKKKKRKE